MAGEMKHPDEQFREIEFLLASLKPTPADLDCDRLLYLAGHAAGRSSAARGWKKVTCALAVTSATLLTALTLTVRHVARPEIAQRAQPKLASGPAEPSPAVEAPITDAPSQQFQYPATDEMVSKERTVATLSVPDPHSYAALRRQILQGDIDSSPAVDHGNGNTAAEVPRPLNMYEQLQRELKQQGAAVTGATS